MRCDLIPPLTLHMHVRAHTHMHAFLSQVSVPDRVNSLTVPLSVLHPVGTAPHLCVSVQPPHPTPLHLTSAEFHPTVYLCGLACTRPGPSFPTRPPPRLSGVVWSASVPAGNGKGLCGGSRFHSRVLVLAGHTCSSFKGAPLAAFHRRCNVPV